MNAQATEPRPINRAFSCELKLGLPPINPVYGVLFASPAIYRRGGQSQLFNPLETHPLTNCVMGVAPRFVARTLLCW